MSDELKQEYKDELSLREHEYMKMLISDMNKE